MAKFAVEVSAADIKKGKRNEPESCPIALAVQRLLPWNSISVNEDTIEIDGCSYDLPKIAEKFVEKFDAKETVEPFSFAISY